jgi:hypothetical protein
MDDIRHAMTGSISDQSKNKEVYAESIRMMLNYLENDESVFYSATSLNGKQDLLKKIEQCKATNSKVVPIIVFLDDSLDKSLCWSRIQADLEGNKDRSNVPEEVLDRQYSRFIKMHDESWAFERSTLGIRIFNVSSHKSTEVIRLANFVAGLVEA